MIGMKTALSAGTLRNWNLQVQTRESDGRAAGRPELMRMIRKPKAVLRTTTVVVGFS